MAAHAKADKDLDSVDSYHEEKEMDASQAMQSLSGINTSDKEEELAETRRLAKIKVKPEDVALLKEQLLMEEEDATLALRRADNDLVKAISAQLAV
eukprot:g51891.t1